MNIDARNVVRSLKPWSVFLKQTNPQPAPVAAARTPGNGSPSSHLLEGQIVPWETPPAVAALAAGSVEQVDHLTGREPVFLFEE
jgi:hypothetical protein